jgi:phage head maturation protease
MGMANRAAGHVVKGVDGQPREVKGSPGVTLAIDAQTGIVEAIVSVFGIVDNGNDVIQPGAFKKSISERGGRVRVLDQHRLDTALRVIGKVLAIREVGRGELPPDILSQYPEATGGLWTRTQYLLDTPEGGGVFKRIASGAMNEYSVGFDIIDAKYEKRTRKDGKEVNARVITTARLWEYSPVIFGQNPATTTVSVKGDGEGDADEDETLPLPTPDETKERPVTVGVMLRNSIAADQYLPKFWLQDGLITLDEFTALTDALVTGAKVVYEAIPEALRDMDASPWYKLKGEAATEMKDAGLPDENANAGRDDAPGDDAEDSAEPGIAPLTLDGIERDMLALEIMALDMSAEGGL